MLHRSQPATFSDNFRGAAYMTASMLAFSINDLIMKFIGGSLNLGQAVMIRGLFASMVIFALAWKLGQMRPLSHALKPLLFMRACGEAMATFLFIKALFHMPMANLSAIMQSLPLALTLSAAFFFGEHVGWRRYTAIFFGILGVLMIVRPGLTGFNVYSVYVLGAVAGCVIRDLATRRLSGDVPSLFITLVTALFVTIMGAGVAFFEDWRPVEWHHLLFLGSTSLFLMYGYFSTVAAVRIGDIGFVSPFRYSILIFAIAGAWLFFSEIPDTMTLAGSLVVVATGIYTLYREHVARRQAITPAPARV
ncbi:MAG: DMT family transporter [Rhizobiaceae bacterium]